MTEKQFIVFDPFRGLYVEAISMIDGDIDTTENRTLARIFQGDSWYQFWQKRGYTIQSLVSVTCAWCDTSVGWKFEDDAMYIICENCKRKEEVYG